MSVVSVVWCAVTGVCDGPITCPGESCQVCCVWMWSRNLEKEEALVYWGCRAMKNILLKCADEFFCGKYMTKFREEYFLRCSIICNIWCMQGQGPPKTCGRPLWRPFEAIFLKISRPRTGLVNIFRGVPKLQINAEEILSRVESSESTISVFLIIPAIS
jgi:hypothetical protein